MKQLLLFLTCFLCLQQTIAQYTQVPDPNFEQALIDLGIDSEGTLDGQFLTTDAENIAYLYINNRNISDLTGVEAFVNLEWLDAFDNNLTSLDLSLIASPNLWTLRISNNNLAEINLSYIPNIVNLSLGNNNFTTIDASNLDFLFSLGVSNNPLTSITLTNCDSLQSLVLVNTLLENIDLSDCVVLYDIDVHDSQVTTLDFSNKQYLVMVRAYNTPLTNINLPNNPNLEYLALDDTLLTALDITHCPGLIEIGFFNTPLNQIDFSGNPLIEKIQGNNSSLTTINVDNNPNLEWLVLSNNNIEGSLSFYNNPKLDIVTLVNNLVQELDFSSNPLLTLIDVVDNPNLEFVNMKNGGNQNQPFFDGRNCPQFSCLVVDDPNAANEDIFVDTNTTLVGSVEACNNLTINEETPQQQLSIYPNPVQDLLNINTNNTKIIKIEIYDVLGKKVLVTTGDTTQIDISNLDNGLYLVNIQTEQGVLVKKIMKE